MTANTEDYHPLAAKSQTIRPLDLRRHPRLGGPSQHVPAVLAARP